ncbi:MAG: hypothetical protein KME35_10450 [Aphanocapsa sp. GSE-SYN-MK-11-07L]|nr:hypothetical protein [Aphanocapsa sp. GSE-SYN-MK-11-07L]
MDTRLHTIRGGGCRGAKGVDDKKSVRIDGQTAFVGCGGAVAGEPSPHSINHAERVRFQEMKRPRQNLGCDR